jgi:PAS domain S-box-containing protein
MSPAAEPRGSGRWPTALSGLLVALIALAGLVYHRVQRQELREREDQTLAAVARLKVAQIQHWRTEREADAQLVRWTPYATRRALDVLRQPTSGSTRDMFTAWFRPLLSAGQFEEVLLCDAELNVALVHPERPARELPPEVRRVATRVLESRQVGVTDLYREPGVAGVRLSYVVPLVVRREAGRDLVPATRQEPAEGSRSAGVLVLQLDATRSLFPLVQDWPTPVRSAETLLLRPELGEVLWLNEPPGRRPATAPARLPREGLLASALDTGAGGSRSFSGSDYRDVAARAAAEPVPGTSWTLVAKVDEAELYAPLRRQGWMTLAVAGLSALAALLGLGLQWRRRELAFERRRREADRDFRVLFEQAAVGVARIDTHTGRFLRINRRYCELLDRSEAELRGSSFETVTHPDDLLGHLQQMEALKSGRLREFTIEKRSLRKHGDVVWVTLTVSPLWAPGEPPSTHIAVVQDITARKRAEAER